MLKLLRTKSKISYIESQSNIYYKITYCFHERLVPKEGLFGDLRYFWTDFLEGSDTEF